MNRKIKTMGTGELAKELGQRKEGKESPSSLAHAWQSKTPVAGTSPLEHTSFHCRAADEFWGGGPCSGAGVIRSAGHTVRAQRTRGRQEMGTTGCRSQMSSFLSWGALSFIPMCPVGSRGEKTTDAQSRRCHYPRKNVPAACEPKPEPEPDTGCSLSADSEAEGDG